MSKGKGGPKEQVTTTKVDPFIDQMRQQIWQRAQGVANRPYQAYQGPLVAGANPASSQAMSGMQAMGGVYQGLGKNFGGVADGLRGPNVDPYGSAGATAAGALAGNQGDVSALMNPYTKNVIDSLDSEYDKQRSNSLLQSNDEATRAGALGGDRAALMTGARLGELDRGELQDKANLLQSGFENTMNRAGQTAGLGLNAQDILGQYGLGLGNLRLGGLQGALGAANGQESALGQAFNMGDYFRNINQQGMDAAHQQWQEQQDYPLKQLGILQNVMTGTPQGSTTSQPLYRNGGAGLLGGAATGLGIGKNFGPLGAGIGAGLGGLIGLFG